MLRDKIADWLDKKLTYMCEHPFKFWFRCAMLGITVGVALGNHELRRQLDNMTYASTSLLKDNAEMYSKIVVLEHVLRRS